MFATVPIMRIAGVVVAALTTAFLVADPGGASAAGGLAAHRVLSAEYHLGDTAFEVPGFTEADGVTPAPIELTASVHYPADLAHGSHPLVLLIHGLWETCADRQAGDAYTAASRVLSGPGASADPAARARAEDVVTKTSKVLNQWPCAPGTPALPSYRGFDYLAQDLASHGFVAVSISANGVNAGSASDEDEARSALINKHLAMWQQLSTQGTGPLAGKLPAGFQGHVDLDDVGTLGHSRGGRAVMYQAAENHRAQWPAGVTVKAVVPLAAAGYYAPDPTAPENDDFRVTTTAFETLIGGCDPVSNPGALDYFTNAAGRNQVPISQLTLRGADHNFFNTQWSPSSGQVLAEDDVDTAVALGQTTRPAPGHCDNAFTGKDERQLTEQQQRALGTTYITAFFRRYLDGDTQFDPLLNGAVGVPGVEVKYQR